LAGKQVGDVRWLFLLLFVIPATGLVVVGVLTLVRVAKDPSVFRSSSFNIFTGKWTDPPDDMTHDQREER
jgi:hypothetical protein